MNGKGFNRHRQISNHPLHLPPVEPWSWRVQKEPENVSIGQDGKVETIAYSFTDEMFAHRLNPMQSQAMQHGTSALHHAKDSYGKKEPYVKEDNNHDNSEGPRKFECFADCHIP